MEFEGPGRRDTAMTVNGGSSSRVLTTFKRQTRVVRKYKGS